MRDAVFVSSGGGWRWPTGSYAVPKRPRALARTWRETATTNVRNIFTPGPIRTRMRARGVSAKTDDAPKPPTGRRKIVDLCLPSLQESGKLYAYPKGRFLNFHPPS